MTTRVAPASHPLAATELLSDDLDLSVMSRNPTRLSEATTARIQAAPLPRTTHDSTDPTHSILMVTHNNLPFTKLCLTSLFASLDLAAEVIIVDNASTDGTVEFLHDLAAANPCVRVIYNNENRSFAAANNQAGYLARGRTIVLLNNDTVVLPGWLSRLCAHLNDPNVGIVCACTNRIGNEAEIDTSYTTVGELRDFATRRAREFAGQNFDLAMAPMFCVAIRGDVALKIGQLDEQFETGMFEDDDYSMRVRTAGLRVCCADDVFVHHFGGASFGNLIADGTHGAIFRANREKFEVKWKTKWRQHGGRRRPDYDSLVDAIRAIVARTIPPASTIAVINKGDVELLKLEGHRAWHFPRQDDGQYSGHYPPDSAAAIAHLESLRENGVEFLLIPRTSMWWLEHYPDFAQHLIARCNRIDIDDDACAIYDLSARPVAAQKESWQDIHLRELCAAILPPGPNILRLDRNHSRAQIDVADYLIIPSDRIELIEPHLNLIDFHLIADRKNVGRIYARHHGRRT